jgi:hypothetical protein
VDLNLQSILVVVSLCIEAAMEPIVCFLPRDICCRWVLVKMEVVVAVAQVGDDATVSIFVEVKAVVMEALALALASKGCLFLVLALLTLLFLA